MKSLFLTLVELNWNCPQTIAQSIKMLKLLGRTQWSGFELRPIYLCVWVSIVICHFVHLKNMELKHILNKWYIILNEIGLCKIDFLKFIFKAEW